LVQASLDLLLKAMKDQQNQVKHSTAWTLSRLFELLHYPLSGFSVISPANLQQLFGVLLEGNKDAPNAAKKVCEAVYYIAQGFEDVESSSFDLTPYLIEIIASLIATADRTDTTETTLRSSAYETLNKVVRCAEVPETAQIIQHLLLAVMNKMSHLPTDKEQQGELQVFLYGVLQVIIQKPSKCDETRYSVL